MWSIGMNLVGFLNAMYTMAAVFTLLGGGAYFDAAGTFAARIGIPAAAFALVGHGNIGQGLGLLVAFGAFM